jgi:2,4-dienoyl-CoA reductase [(3E)-enoyl-CoA-producing], peroxisomal
LNSAETQTFDIIMFAGKYVSGTTLVVDGGLWLSHPRHIPKEEVRELSKVVEKKVRASGVGVTSSKL